MDPLSQLTPGPTHNGVTLRTAGQGTPVFVVPGMEGTGESCFHLAHPVLRDLDTYQFVLVDYGAEVHDSFDALVDTLITLIGGAAGDHCVFWGQSFGNLLAAAVAEGSNLPVEQLLLVSPFTRLPNWKVALGVTVLSLTPPPLYRATARLGGRYLFGPAGDQPDHPFFDSLRRSPPRDVARRTNWLRKRSFASVFSGLSAPTRVWLGAEDRLVDLDAQKAYFSGLAGRRDHVELTMIPESGHVVLPSTAVASTREQLRSALRS